MSKFIAAASVADYVQMIDEPSMKMARYKMDKPVDADGTQFVEIMSFDLQLGADIASFNKINLQVETDYTGKQDGFLQRATGVNQEGRQAVVAYWKNKTNSDAALAGFMAHRIAKKLCRICSNQA